MPQSPTQQPTERRHHSPHYPRTWKIYLSTSPVYFRLHNRYGSVDVAALAREHSAKRITYSNDCRVHLKALQH